MTDPTSQSQAATSVVEAVHLGAYKSFTGATLPLDALTLVVGRNGSGKSNALEGLWALSRLAHGEDVREALDGGRDGPAVRGGVGGCAPFGQSSFALGTTVRTGEQVVRLDVVVQVQPEVQVTLERLTVNDQIVLQTRAPDPGSSDIGAAWDDGSGSLDRVVAFRASRLLTTQVLSRIPATSAGQRLHLAAAQVIAALRAVFVLDPVPHLMRQYVPARDVQLRRDADNLSAAVADLIAGPDGRDVISTAMGLLNEQDVTDVGVTRSDLDDLMLTLTERGMGGEHVVSARVMSDGSLRFLAILAALMQAPTRDTMPERMAADDAIGQTVLVVEELENGLHASQAATLLDLIRTQVGDRRIRALATAHSPALLDALTGEEHRAVVVCQRDRQGRSTLTPLVELPNYWRIAAKGGLGRAATDDRLREQAEEESPGAVLDEIFGGETS